ncbi:MAG: hypothetical protein IPH79_09200 [Sphingomonadales bacterium]|nr:hypothetical protein [Sphingomonadales bacterium]
MKIAAALILTATASTCSQPSPQVNEESRTRAIAAAAEAMCRDGGRASALSDIADLAAATPKAGIGQTVYEAASDIEQSGCAQIVTDNQANWQKQDALMSEVKAAAKK